MLVVEFVSGIGFAVGIVVALVFGLFCRFDVFSVLIAWNCRMASITAVVMFACRLLLTLSSVLWILLVLVFRCCIFWSGVFILHCIVVTVVWSFMKSAIIACCETGVMVEFDGV